jgi:lipopolysaccharide export system permease protein
MKLIKIVDKYLIAEFAKPFLFMVFALTIIMISSFLFELTDFIIIKKIPSSVVVNLLLYRVPQVMVDSLSMAVLFSTILSLSRLVKDSEFTALRMAGINFWRLLIPLLILGILISGLTYMMNEKIVPWSNTKYHNIIKYSIHKKEDPKLHQDVFFKWKNSYFYLGEVNDENKEISRVIVYEQLEEKNKLIIAKKGYVDGSRLYLKNALFYRLGEDNYSQEMKQLSQLEFDIGKDITEFYGEEKKSNEMNRAELEDRIELFKASGKDVSKLLVEYHLNLSEALVSLIFVLIGAPLSIKSNKGRIFGIIASLIIIFVYYVMQSISRSLGLNGILPPFLAAWLPNIIFTIIGFILILKEDYINIR